jgi:ribA/ribD-fused uncharacterized protein
MPETIQFYRVSDEYGWMSNFAGYPIELDGRTWPTSEHYFQAQKFLEHEHQEAIRTTRSPMIAARMGRDRKRPLRRDWESVKIGMMQKALLAKFTQHADLRERLLATGDATIVEHTQRDCYWGDGGDGNGQNVLGRLLMEVRNAIAQSAAARPGPRPPNL